MKTRLAQVVLVLVLFTATAQSLGGNALDFDGSNDFIQVASGPIISTSSNSTISAWVKVPSIDANTHTIYSEGTSSNVFCLRLDSSGKAAFLIHANSSWNVARGSSTLSAGKWYHVAATLHATNGMTVYVNGDVDATNPNTSPTNSGTILEVEIGQNTVSGERFLGTIDEVRVWNKALTQTEIRALMHYQINSGSSGLAGYWRLNASSGTTATDETSNNDGTLTSMDPATDWIVSTAPLRDMKPGYQTNVKAIWWDTGTSPSDASNGLWMTVGTTLVSGNSAVYGNNNISGTSTNDLASSAATQRTGRIWYVDETGAVSASVTIDIGDATDATVSPSDFSGYRLLYRSGLTGDFTDVTVSGTSGSGDQVTFSGVALQDGFYTLGSVDQPLPVQLVSFAATAGDRRVILNWTTGSEIDNQAFLLQKSTDAVNFAPLAEIKGQGTTSESSEYSFEDLDVINGLTYYYRLGQQDINGTVTWFSTVNATPGLDQETARAADRFELQGCYPNPFNPGTAVRFNIPDAVNESQNISLTVYNTLGQKIASLQNGNMSPGLYTLNWNGCDDNGTPQPAGIYFFRLHTGNQDSFTRATLLR